MAATTIFRAGDTEHAAHGALWMKRRRAKRQPARPARAARVFALLLFCLVIMTGPVQAATWWTVDSNADTATGSGTSGTLRWVIEQAASGDTIQFAPGLDGQTITLGSAIDAGAKNLNLDPKGGTITFAGAAIQGTGSLSLPSYDSSGTGYPTYTTSGNLIFNNAVNFENGISSNFSGSPVGLDLADYTGGGSIRWRGPFSGKVRVENQTSTIGNAGSGMSVTGTTAKATIREGSILRGNTVENTHSIDPIPNTVYGGGLYASYFDSIAGLIANNAALVTNTGIGGAQSRGGGMYVVSVDTLSATISGNRAEADAAGGGEAVAIGGGIYSHGDITITGGEYTGNRAIATGATARAEGGAIFMDVWRDAGVGKMTLDPSAGAITFSGNKVVANGVEKANAIHFGRYDLSSAPVDVILELKNTASNTNVVTIADGITTDINNGKTFTITQSGGNFLWGGPNKFDSAGGDTVSLTGGSMRLANGFTLDRGALNTTPGSLLAFTVTGGNLKSEGAATGLKNTALNVTSGGKLTVDLGSTLTLDAASTFALSGGTLSFGVGAGNTSGKIDITANTTTAPTFAGSNTLDISEWIAGAYTVLQAGKEMAAGAASTFTAFTVGGMAPGTGVTITPTLSPDLKSLIVTAGLNQDSAEKVWGGTTGTWDYTAQKWGVSNDQTFVLGDLAKFDGTNASGAGLTVTVGTGAGSRVETAGMSITGGSYTFTGGKIVGRTDISQNPSFTPTGRLDIAGTGNIVFNNAVDFSGGLMVAGGSSANITLADYTGGRVVLGGEEDDNFIGTLSGKLTITGETLTDTDALFGGALQLLQEPGIGDIRLAEIREGSLISRGELTVTGASDAPSAEAMGGGIYTNKIGLMAGIVEHNIAIANPDSSGTGSAYVEGGGIYSANGINTLSGIVRDNLAYAEGGATTGTIQAWGGGVRDLETLTSGGGIGLLSGTVQNNRVDAKGGVGDSRTIARGGGISGSLSTFTGAILENSAYATVMASERVALAFGGGANLFQATTLAGDVKNNLASATATDGLAHAGGGGLHLEPETPVTITRGEYSGNRAEAFGQNAEAVGGAIFMDTADDVASLTLDPTAGAITFSGNTVAVNGVGTPNAIHIGRTGYYDASSQSNAFLTIQNSASNTNLITIADGITTDINNGKMFMMRQTGGNFLWGGPNTFDSANGSFVQLTGGTTRLMNGFTLDRGALNTTPGSLLAFNVTTGGNLKSEGAATSLKNTALSVSSGGKLTVDLGSTLTLDAASTFALNGGTLSFGVGANDASGKIDMTANTTTAPTFAGANTLDISEWIAGAYTVLQAGKEMVASEVNTFTAFTVGGLAPGAGVTITPTLSPDLKSLLVTAGLNQDSAEKVWGGTTGTWDYTAQKWGVSNDQTFVLGDLAKFDGTNASGAGLTVTVGTGAGSQVETAGMSITGGSYTFTGGKIVGRTDISQGSGITPTGRLNIAGGGTIVFNNAVEFEKGISGSTLSPAGLVLADYTGGRIDTSGSFSGKVRIENQAPTTTNAGGGLFLFSSATATIQEGSIIRGNTVSTNNNNSGLYASQASGGGLMGLDFDSIAGLIADNLAKNTNIGSSGAQGVGGGMALRGIGTLSATVSGNRAEANAVGGGEAAALGGGIISSGDGDITIVGGSHTGNQAVAVGAIARAQGGAIFKDTWDDGSGSGGAALILDPTAGAITFSGNTVTTKANAGDTGATTANAIHFGRQELSSNSGLNAALEIKDTNTTNNLITIADGITTDINNGKTFTMTQSAGNFLWGGPNKFDSAGGDTVSLTGGSMRLANGFTLDRGALNTTPGSLLAFTVTGGNLKSEGAATGLSNTALSVSGGKLTVDLGSTLTLDSASTFALNSGTLSFGVGAGNTSGKIDITANTTTAPTFAGSNTLDISEWIAGAYTVLQAGKEMAAGAASTFTAFTVGGLTPGTGVTITPTLSSDAKSLIVTAGLNQDSAEKVWGGTTGTWDYTAQKWGVSNDQTFVLGDLAIFDGTGATGTPLAVTVGTGAGSRVETAGMSITGGSYTFSGGKIVGRTDISQGSAITPTGRLSITGGGTIVFNNAVEFEKGISSSAMSPAGLVLADYTGGRISTYGSFSGKVRIENQILTTTNFGGGLGIGTLDVATIREGSIIRGNTVSRTSDNSGLYAPSASGGGVLGVNFDSVAGLIADNRVINTNTGSSGAESMGGGMQANRIDSLSATISGNRAEADAAGGGEATALGGGSFWIGHGDITIIGGSHTDNRAVAVGSTARAQGGAIFRDTWDDGTGTGKTTLTLDPTAGAITFSGNKVAVNGVETPNAIHFGRQNLTSNSGQSAALEIKDTGNTNNLITIADGITTDINNGKTFTMAQSAGNFLWGGPNLFDSAGGDTVSLTGGSMRLANGFTLDRGALNTTPGSLLAFTVTGGNLKSEGAATGLKHTALSVSGGKLTVDLGSTLTLDANSIFTLDGGTLSFGVGANDASGKIVSLNATTAPSFAGSNTLDISDWIHGTYTVLSAGTAMNAGDLDTFTKFTVGGNAINPTYMGISAALANRDKELQITAQLSRDNKEVAWGSADGAWNYTDQNWLDNGNASPFLPDDAALFNSASGTHSIKLGGTAISLSGMKVTGPADYALSGAALHIDAANAQNLPAIDYANHLFKEGTGTLLLNTGSAANPNVIAGAVIVKDGTLALGDGFTMTNTGTGHNMLVGFGQGGSPALDVRGAATLNNMILELADSELRFTAPNSSLSINVNGSSLLNAGVMDVDLNRAKTLAAITLTGGGRLFLDESTLRLRHTGLTSDSGTWLLVDGIYDGQFDAVDIATATLTGTVNYDTANSQVLFDGAYTVADGTFPGYSSLSPNAQRAWSGFRDAFYNGRTAFMGSLDAAYSSTAVFQADLLNMLPNMSAEGAVSQGIQALSAHNAAAMAAFGYAFGNDALESARSFAPLAFQAPNTLGFNIGSQNRRDQARLTGRYADRMASLDGNFGYQHSSYSVLGNWQPATDMTRNLVASASPEFTLNAAGGAASGPNTPFGVRIWGGYLGNFAHQDNKGGYAGYDADQNGFLLGGSFDISPNWTAGAYVGWTTGETRYSGIRTRIDTDATHVGVFARYRREAGPGTVKITGDILYSYTDNDSRRTVPTALGNQHMKGSFDQNIWGGGLEAAYDWKPSFDENTVITPYLAGRYAHLEQDGFTESGNLGLKVGKTDADSFTTTVGVKAARDFQVSDTVILTPKATVGWLHQWADRDVSTNSNFIGSPVTFMTRSVKQDADAALVGAGLDVLVKTGQSWDLGLKLGYGADIRKSSNDQTVFVGVEIKF